MCIPFKEQLEEKNKYIEELQATCAAMREVLEFTRWCYEGGEHWVCADDVMQAKGITFEEAVIAALAPDAGKALLERLAKAEANAVESVKRDDVYEYVCADLYQMSGENIYYVLNSMFDYLRDHNMIREAE